MKVTYIPSLAQYDLHVETPRPTGSRSALASEPIALRLRRYCRPGSAAAERPRVLLLHGANTNGDAFTMASGLAAYLRDARDADVWVLDWRGSSYVMRRVLEPGTRPLFHSAADERAVFSIDRVAAEDIPAALDKIVEVTGSERPIAIVGFCVGGGALALAVARGHVRKPRVERIVMMTLGLFYNVPWDGWIKSQEHLLELVIEQQPGLRAIDPFRPAEWPKAMAEVYGEWPSSWFAPQQEETFHRLTFMYGEPFSPPALRALPPLQELFGPLHLGLYTQAVQWVRDGFPPDLEPHGDARALQEMFRGFDVTLVTGAQNRLWHRESIDLMYEWLRRDPGSARGASRCRKKIFRDYAHLDMLWANDAQLFGYLADAAGT